jgi:hypothetical protein
MWSRSENAADFLSRFGEAPYCCALLHHIDGLGRCDAVIASEFDRRTGWGTAKGLMVAS